MTSLSKSTGLAAYEVRVRIVEQRKAYVIAKSPEAAIARAKVWHDEGASDAFEADLESADDWQACEVLP